MVKKKYSIFDTLGLLSLYIIDDSGLPLIVKGFDKTEMQEEDNIIITSFSSAISIFAQNLLISYITDIGIFSKRLFFKYQSGFIYLLVFDEDIIQRLKLHQLHELITIAIWHLDIKFKEFYEEMSQEVKRYALPFEIRKNENFVEELLEKGCRDWLEVNKNKFLDKEQAQPFLFDENSVNFIVKQLGLNAVYLLDTNNDPKFTRVYDPTSPLVSNETTMSSLLTAIGTFTRALLVSYVSDVGMFNQRIFLRHVKHYTLVLIIDDLKFLTASRKNEETIFNFLFSNLISEFKPKRGRPRKRQRSRRKIQTNTAFKYFVDEAILRTIAQYEDLRDDEI